LDPAANETARPNAPVPDDSMEAERKRAADWPHWPERGNGRARRARLERRLFRDSEREAGLVEAHEATRPIEEAAVDWADVGRPRDPVPEPRRAPATSTHDHLLFAWTPRGYALHERPDELPAIGALVRIDGHEYTVAKLTESPLPGDPRRCAYLDPL
jgi:hypothetical protein